MPRNETRGSPHQSRWKSPVAEFVLTDIPGGGCTARRYGAAPDSPTVSVTPIEMVNNPGYKLDYLLRIRMSIAEERLTKVEMQRQFDEIVAGTRDGFGPEFTAMPEVTYRILLEMLAGRD